MCVTVLFDRCDQLIRTAHVSLRAPSHASVEFMSDNTKKIYVIKHIQMFSKYEISKTLLLGEWRSIFMYLQIVGTTETCPDLLSEPLHAKFVDTNLLCLCVLKADYRK